MPKSLNNQIHNNEASIENSYTELSKRYHALFKLNKLLHQCESINDFYRQVHETIASLITADNFYIALCDRTLQTVEFVYHVDEKDKVPAGTLALSDIEGSYTKYLFDLGEPVFITENSVPVLPLIDSKIVHSENCIDWFGVPLIHQNIVIGVMAVQNYSHIHRHVEEDLDLLNFAGQQVVAAMTRLHEQEQLKQAVNARTAELMGQIKERERSELLQESLFKISELSNNSAIDINKFYYQVHNIVGQLINAENFYIAKLDKSKEHLNFVFYLDTEEQLNSGKFKARKLGNYFTEMLIRKKKTILLTQQDMLDLYHSGEVVAPHPDTCSWLGAPLQTDGEAMGAMVVQSYHPSIMYTEQDVELINFVAHHVSSAIKRRDLIEFERQYHEMLERQVQIRTEALEDEIKQRIEAEEKLKYAASHDSLTGLANRSVFIDLLNHAIACRKRKPSMQFALLFLDLDRFKVVNDSLGHHAGDQLLKIVARELQNFTREKDTVARLGGDEFVILIEDLEDTKEAFYVAERITKMLDEPVFIDNQPVFIGTSIGVLFSDDSYHNANVMLRDADTAMYQAKEKGKGRYEVFDTSMQLKVQNALALETDIREAINLSEFEPYFQSIVQLSDNKVVGFEALARWHSHKRGIVYPDNFISLAEDTGLIKEIDLQVLEKSCIELKKWQKEYHCEYIYISCNLFCEHFFSPTLPNEIAEIIERVGIKPEQLRLELTERALLEKSNVVLDNMKRLKALGVKILLDDFGTGYSSLSYLHRFPIDVLKIDRSFIRNVHEHDNNHAIIKAIIDLATNLGMSTVGEGIEHIEDAQLLKVMECLYGQGYYFSKPLPANDIRLVDLFTHL
jgi:diguanylate cyclase (GGDEF)-like protein